MYTYGKNVTTALNTHKQPFTPEEIHNYTKMLTTVKQEVIVEFCQCFPHVLGNWRIFILQVFEVR